MKAGRLGTDVAGFRAGSSDAPVRHAQPGHVPAAGRQVQLLPGCTELQSLRLTPQDHP